MTRMRPFLTFIAVTLVFHIVWEHLHIGLYAGYQSMKGVVPAWMLTTLGDLFYTLVIIGVISLAKRNLSWVAKASWQECGATAMLGFLVALMVEYKGLYLGRWQYLPSMPIIPFLGVGLSPIIQMTFLTPLSLFVVTLFSRHDH